MNTKLTLVLALFIANHTHTTPLSNPLNRLTHAYFSMPTSYRYGIIIGLSALCVTGVYAARCKFQQASKRALRERLNMRDKIEIAVANREGKWLIAGSSLLFGVPLALMAGIECYQSTEWYQAFKTLIARSGGTLPNALASTTPVASKNQLVKTELDAQNLKRLKACPTFEQKEKLFWDERMPWPYNLGEDLEGEHLSSDEAHDLLMTFIPADDLGKKLDAAGL